jgi:hypothetical protein
MSLAVAGIVGLNLAAIASRNEHQHYKAISQSSNNFTSPSRQALKLISQDSHLAVGHAVEVIGKVDGNLALKVQASTDFGTNIGKLLLMIPRSSHHLQGSGWSDSRIYRENTEPC